MGCLCCSFYLPGCLSTHSLNQTELSVGNRVILGGMLGGMGESLSVGERVSQVQIALSVLGMLHNPSNFASLQTAQEQEVCVYDPQTL